MAISQMSQWLKIPHNCREVGSYEVTKQCSCETIIYLLQSLSQFQALRKKTSVFKQGLGRGGERRMAIKLLNSYRDLAIREAAAARSECPGAMS